MSEIMSRAAYLKGLAEGMKLDENTNEGKLFYSIIDVINDLAEEIACLDDEQDAICDELEELEDVIEVIGDEVFDVSDCESGEYQIPCSQCGEEIIFTDDDLDAIASGEFECPACGKVLELDFSGCDCDDCN